VSVKNDRAEVALPVQIECGFFKRGQLIATDFGYLHNIAPGTSGYKTVLAHSDISPDHAQRRIAKAQ
jgi:hypothetical protein